MSEASKTSISRPLVVLESTRLPLILVCLILCFVIVRSSWIGDDGYIMLRQVKNIIQGYGPVFNPGERVNGVTPPLYPWILAGFIRLTHEYFLTTTLIGISFTVSAVVLALRFIVPDRTSGITLCLLLLSSKSFIDYSTSGLESPFVFFGLSVLGLTTLTDRYRAQNLGWIVLASALVALGRPDTILLAAPVGLWAFVDFVFIRKALTFGKAFRVSLLAISPLLFWYAWSIVYYGFPFPNTYYAKVGVFEASQISPGSMIAQGMLYYLNVLENDVPTLLILILGTLLGLRSRSGIQRVWAVAIAVYSLMIIKVGGDFMGGRFFAVLVLMAALIIVRVETAWHSRLLMSCTCLLLGCLMPRPVYKYGSEHESTPLYTVQKNGWPEVVDHRGVADERRAYWNSMGLLSALNREGPNTWEDYSGDDIHPQQPVMLVPYIGMAGFGLGPKTYVIDPFGLTDPFIARLASTSVATNKRSWRIGHFPKMIPEGFVESKITRQNMIRDPKLRTLYGALQLIATGPIWSKDRWQAIWEVNTGKYTDVTKGYFFYPFDKARDESPLFKDLSAGAYFAPRDTSTTSKGGGASN